MDRKASSHDVPVEGRYLESVLLAIGYRFRTLSCIWRLAGAFWRPTILIIMERINNFVAARGYHLLDIVFVPVRHAQRESRIRRKTS
jgi:hypothetical protein